MSRILTVFVVLFTLVTTSIAQDMKGFASLLKSDLRLAKRELMGRNITFTEVGQAQLFWGIYNEHEKESNKIKFQQISLLNRYEKSSVAMSNSLANQLAKESFAIDKQKNKLLQKTYKQIASKLSPTQAIEFLQLEKKISTIMEMQIASGIAPAQSTESQAPSAVNNGTTVPKSKRKRKAKSVTVGKPKAVIEVRVEE